MVILVEVQAESVEGNPFEYLLLFTENVESNDFYKVSRNADQYPAFFAVYNMETTEIISFYQNSADELYLLFEHFCDHFHATSRNPLSMNFISSHSNNIHALEQLRLIKNKSSSFSQFVKKMMASLPFSCQSQSPSPYFDQSLFRFDEKV
ncbi:Light-mediated development protein DET1 [Vitis vinifera]|uniref:Light-mediated development protein DET1 n=1 Tax=Vitis vinifera TaxID=29760 RepID=A0A438HL58_VITVI|nr:Light-mediated development protein DET1 [Vitis vinifera]